MNSIAGLYIVCELILSVYVPSLGKVMGEQFIGTCLVVDDNFTPIPDGEKTRYPMIVDCSVDKNWHLLNIKESGIYMVYKGEQCVE